MNLQKLNDKRLSVLVVDDEDDIREMLTTFLDMMDVFDFIVEARDGAEAFNKCQIQQFDLIITDLMMPKVKGITFIENMLKKEKNLIAKDKSSFIILSGNVTSTEVAHVVKLGIKNILTKPCSAEQFMEKVALVMSEEKKDKVKLSKT